MKITSQCIPCLLDRVLYESELCTGDKDVILNAMKTSLQFIGDSLNPESSTISISTGIHRAAFSVLGDVDAYAGKKEFSNHIIKSILPDIEKMIDSGKNEIQRFHNTVLASIVANSLDFGVSSHRIEEKDFIPYFMEEYHRGLQVDHTPEIWERSEGEILYLFDNCGEIYVDSLVLEMLRERATHITGVVRGAPILNDALLEDAKAAGIEELVDQLLTTGGNAIGIIEEEAPPELLSALRESDLIVSKGMANYEALSEMDDIATVAYLLRTKCEPVARSLGVKKDSNVAMLVQR